MAEPKLSNKLKLKDYGFLLFLVMFILFVIYLILNIEAIKTDPCSYCMNITEQICTQIIIPNF